jgi:hypothetical protein
VQKQSIKTKRATPSLPRVTLNERKKVNVASPLDFFDKGYIIAFFLAAQSHSPCGQRQKGLEHKARASNCLNLILSISDGGHKADLLENDRKM